MARTPSEWTKHEYKDNKWQTVIDDTLILGLNSTGISDDLSGSADINVAGGYRSQISFSANNVNADESNAMSASLGPISASSWTPRHVMASNGSILGLTLYSPDSFIGNPGGSGVALTASVTIDGVQDSSVQLIMTTGSAGALGLVAKDTVTFSASQQIGVVLTASDGYTSSLAGSGSFIASIFVEM